MNFLIVSKPRDVRTSSLEERECKSSEKAALKSFFSISDLACYFSRVLIILSIDGCAQLIV
jgi:hypothetical protein